MFNNITWQGYWVTLALLTAGYYLVVYLLYFRKDVQLIFPKRQPLVNSPSASPAVTSFLKDVNQPSLSPDKEGETGTLTEGEEALFHACMDEVGAYFQGAKKSKFTRSEVRFALQKILSKYSALNDTPYKESINHVIVSEADHHCFLQFSSEEIDQVWLEN